VTALAVAAGGEVLVVGAIGRHPAAVGVVTGAADVVHLVVGVVGQRRRIAVAATAVGPTGCCTGNRDQRVVRGEVVVVIEVRALPTGAVTGLTVAAHGKRLQVGAKRRHQAAVAVMAVRAVRQVRRRIDQGVGMTARAVVGAGRGDQAAVIRRCRMQPAPVVAVTGGAVAAIGEVLVVGAQRRHQRAVGIVTGRTEVMHLVVGVVGQRRRIAVTAAAAGRVDLQQRIVRGEAVVVVEVRGLPTGAVTGLAVAAGEKRLQVGVVGGHQAAVAVMTVRAIGEMRRRIDQGVGMTARAVVGAGCRDQAAVIRRCRMQPAPVGTVTGGAVAAGDEVQTHNGDNQAAVGVVTVATGAMHFGVSVVGQRRRIAVTACTLSRAHLDQRVVRGEVVVVVEVRALPTQGMAGLAVAAGGERLQVGIVGGH